MTRKAIFITGGGSGIGRAIAHYFAARDWFVGLGDVDMAGMQDTQGGLQKGFSYLHEFDVRDRSAWDEALRNFATAAGGRIDVLANNAGIGLGGPLAEMSEGELTRCLDVNLKGALFGAQAAYPYLKQTAPSSCLVTTCSAAGMYGAPNMSVYCATKFGVRAMTESLDAEWAEDGIRVRSVMPSFIDTPLLDHTSNERDNESVRQKVQEAGLEITPVASVAEAVWAAVHGDRLHTAVGATAKRLQFATRWMPKRVRKMQRSRVFGA